MFDENGEFVEVQVPQNGAGTPAARSVAGMQSDVGASAKVRKEHEEGRTGGAQVSFTAICLLVSHRVLTCLSSGVGCVASLAISASWCTTSYLVLERLSVSSFLPETALSSTCYFFLPTYFLYTRQFQEHISTMYTDVYQLPGDDMDIDLPIFGDDLIDSDAFPTAGSHQGNDQIEVVHSTSTVPAPMRKKKRNPKVLPVDTRMELRHKDLTNWNANYVQIMDAVAKSKKQGRAAQQAKKNAEYFVWGRGLGGIAQHYAGVDGPNPFDMFIGDNLFELATGVSRKKVAGTKHDRDSGIDDETQNESRNVRQKTSEPEEEMGRGQDDEGFFMPGGDEVELPREGVTALDDHQVFSSMPWNQSASRHGSSAIPRSGHPGIMDQGKPGSRPGNRMVSASPLHGRGQPLDSDALRNLESDDDLDMGGDDYAPPGPSSSPVRALSQVKPTTHVNEALDAEGNNFLDFVTDAIGEKRNRVQVVDADQAEAAEDTDIITFEELLPPHENHRMVACQGLMMVLSLGTKGMLDVQQPEGFGDINVKLTEKAKASQVVEISDGHESEEEDEESDGGVEFVGERVVESQEGAEDEDDVDEQAVQVKQEIEVEQEAGEEEGHFEEQFAAGHAAYEESEHDELYDN
jgi:meiotic recombination protein REC8